ncbi:hypothetical protein LCGC14_1071700 [marine sediment metagenome]|uniref:Uncharacterized protein n=1 Tax=marine sediment metagenome TaxID=412755 RepID=A0A0F9MHZ1_9ZZZZ
MTGEIKKPTQEKRIYDYLEAHMGEWINGQYFLRTMMISQYHARIWSLQEKGHKIEASEFKDQWGFKSYRLTPKEPIQSTLDIHISTELSTVEV